MLLNKKLSNVHPYPLIGWTCLFGGMYYLSSFGFLPMCKFDIAKLLGYSIFDHKHYFRLLYDLIFSWKVIHYSSTTVHLTLNFLVQTDIYLTIRQPFQPRANRKKYFILATFFALFVTWVVILRPENILLASMSLNLYDLHSAPNLTYWLFGISVFMYILSSVMTLIVFIRLRKEGASAELKKFYL